ncbi:invasion associated locus B family protein [uncultured Tateyamaria sp.]|uniref:invasion associated locus B family protein n=1 Tax=uncultured Tateyamaria sp. TaxID=455651 RepID=UPI0026060836|nr:invasion associated locus B family protein [uncultured Tateyamaria sp.]
MSWPFHALAQDTVDWSVPQEFEDWRVTCTAQASETCRVWQRVQIAHEGKTQDVMAVSVAPSDEGLVLLVQVPIDVFLPADFGLRIDGQNERRVRYRNCNQAGCWVLIVLNDRLLRQLQSGLTAETAMSLVEGETVRVSFSLRGFTAAMAAFEKARASYE